MTAQTFKERRAALVALGFDMTPEMVGGSIALSAPEIDESIYEGVVVAKDIPYGEHARQVLDVYSDGTADGSKPVLVYVHGGGFIQGAKDSPTTPYFKNLGAWAVKQGYVAVTMNYRLAPEFKYPSGAQDVASVITWIVDHIAEYGGDPKRIFLSGQSAGSMHVADYVVGHGGYGPHGRALAGAIIISCLYDVSRAVVKDMHTAYWGEDTSKWADYATLPGLLETDLPIICTVSEYDQEEFLDHAAQFVGAWYERHQDFPPLHRLYGQNHLTPVYAIGSQWDVLGPLVKRFIEANG